MNKVGLQALSLSGTYSHKTGTRPPSCGTPQQPTINVFLCIFIENACVNELKPTEKLN